MTSSRKEIIIAAIEARLKTILLGNVDPKSGYVYENTVTYVDRQYQIFELEDIANHPKPWIIVNNNGERFGPLPGKKFENAIMLDVIGFVSVDETHPNLDTAMNSLQKDIIIAMLSDDNLSGLAAYVLLLSVETVSEMIWPHGGFAIQVEVTYHFAGYDL
jgi:hypothetical protein